MNLLRITNGFDKLSDANLEARANNIVASMTGNASFATPSPTLAVVQTAIDNYSAALAKAQTGSSYDKAYKNQKKGDLIDLLHSLGNYVLFTANGDELVAKSSGYNIAKGPSPAPEVSAAVNQNLEDGANAGELKYSFDKVPGARSYMYQYAPDPLTENSTWQSQPGTIRKIVFSGLDSGKKYFATCHSLLAFINHSSLITVN